MAKSNALKKLQSQKGTVKTKTKTRPKLVEAPKKTKKENKKVSKKKSAKSEIPSASEISMMKAPDLDYFHSKLPEELDGWADLDRSGKRRELSAALHDDEDDTVVTLKKKKTSKKSTKKASKEKKDTASKAKKATAEKTTKSIKAKKSKKAGKGHNVEDVLATAVNDIENLTEEEVDTEVHHLKEDIEYNYFRLGGVLAVIKQNKFIGDYKNFREKVEAEFGMKYRKAEYLVSVYNNIIESGVSWSILSAIGWSKLKTISHLITPENVEEWVAKAEEMNVSSLEDEVRRISKAGSKNPGKKAKTNITSMTFKVHDDQRENIELALDKAKEELDTDVNTVAIEAICLEYLAGGKKAVTVKEPTILQFFKSVLKEADGNEEKALGTLLEGKEFKKVFGVEIGDLVNDDED